jgi:uncharacterized protein (DUF608 family)
MAKRMAEGAPLFPLDLPANEWLQFPAAGFSRPVCGFLRRRANPANFGMPLGAVDTGCLGIDTDGTLGLCSIFNSFVPMRGPLKLPFLGMTAGRQVWVLSTIPFASNESLYYQNLATPSEIHYWGHYPVLDVEYGTPGSPVGIGMRAWSPFIVGDAAASNTPAAVFEVHLRNATDAVQEGRVVFSFPGPTQEEAQVAHGSPRVRASPESAPGKRPHTWLPVAARQVRARAVPVEGEFTGVAVTTEAGNGVGYAIGVVGEAKVQVGRGLGRNREAWERLGAGLPPVTSDTDLGRSIAVEYRLEPGGEKVFRLVLAWYAPVWIGEADHDYRHRYSARFADVLEVARFVARGHGALLSRVLAWQQELYAEPTLPVWLREALVNVLHLFPVCSLWALAEPPVGGWCREEDGLFGLLSGIIDWPDMEVIPDSFYGHVPVVLFFPELLLSEMRGHKAYQFPNGAVTWLWGGVSAEAKGGYLITAGTEMATPSPGFQTVTNGACYVDMVDRLLMRTGSGELLEEFYPSVKKSTIYSMGLRPEDGDDGLISVPSGNVDPYNPQREEGHMLEWFEAVKLYGMVTHIGGIHLAQLAMAERMAKRVGDAEFARQCRSWIQAAGRSMESLWNGSSYLLYSEPKTGRRSDLVFGYQLDGDWMAKFHGLAGVFPPDRAKTVLETIRRVNAAITPYGAADLVALDGRQSEGVGFGAVTFFVSEMSILVSTYLYAGEREFGLELARRMQVALNREWGCTWDQPNVLRGDTGEKTLGSQLLQSMFLWIVPAAAMGQDLEGFSAPGGLVDRMVRAAAPV